MGRHPRSESENLERLEHILEGATRSFADSGYRGTTMAKVADTLSLSPGTLYLYFSGKEALFHSVIAYCLLNEWESYLDGISGSAFGNTETIALLSRQFRRLVAESPVGWPVRDTTEDPASELEDVLRALYQILFHHQDVIRIVERSRNSWPELAESVEHTLVQGLRRGLADYLSIRIRAGQLEAVADTGAASTIMLDCMSQLAGSKDAQNPRHQATLFTILVRGMTGVRNEAGGS